MLSSLIDTVLKKWLGDQVTSQLEKLIEGKSFKGPNLEKWKQLLDLLLKIRLDDVIHALKQVIKNLTYYDIAIGGETYEKYVTLLSGGGLIIGSASFSAETPITRATKVPSIPKGNIRFVVGPLADLFGSEIPKDFLVEDFLLKRGLELCDPSDIYPIALALAADIGTHRKHRRAAAMGHALLCLGMKPVEGSVYQLEKDDGKPISITSTSTPYNSNWESHPTSIWIFRCKEEPKE